MGFIENLVNNSTVYYCLVGVVYVLCIIFVVMLLVKSKRKKHVEIKQEVKKDIDSVDLESVLEKMQAEVNKQKDPIMTFEEEQEDDGDFNYGVKVVRKRKIGEEPKVESKAPVQAIVLTDENEPEVLPDIDGKKMMSLADMRKHQNRKRF